MRDYGCRRHHGPYVSQHARHLYKLTPLLSNPSKSIHKAFYDVKPHCKDMHKIGAPVQSQDLPQAHDLPATSHLRPLVRAHRRQRQHRAAELDQMRHECATCTQCVSVDASDGDLLLDRGLGLEFE